MFILRTEASIDINQLRANMKKILLFLGMIFLLKWCVFYCCLVGKDENLKQQRYHKNLKIKSCSVLGRFFEDYTRLDDDLYDIVRTEGSSTLSKAFNLPLDEECYIIYVFEKALFNHLITKSLLFSSISANIYHQRTLKFKLKIILLMISRLSLMALTWTGPFVDFFVVCQIV